MLLSNAIFLDTEYKNDCQSKIDYINLDSAENPISIMPDSSGEKSILISTYKDINNNTLIFYKKVN